MLPALLLSQRDENSDYVGLFRLLLRLKTTKRLVYQSRNRRILYFFSAMRSIAQEFTADALAAE